MQSRTAVPPIGRMPPIAARPRHRRPDLEHGRVADALAAELAPVRCHAEGRRSAMSSPIWKTTDRAASPRHRAVDRAANARQSRSCGATRAPGLNSLCRTCVSFRPRGPRTLRGLRERTRARERHGRGDLGVTPACSRANPSSVSRPRAASSPRRRRMRTSRPRRLELRGRPIALRVVREVPGKPLGARLDQRRAAPPRPARPPARPRRAPRSRRCRRRPRRAVRSPPPGSRSTAP